MYAEFYSNWRDPYISVRDFIRLGVQDDGWCYWSQLAGGQAKFTDSPTGDGTHNTHLPGNWGWYGQYGARFVIETPTAGHPAYSYIY